MTLRQIERQADRFVPMFFVTLSVLAAFATAGLGI